jgi:hypothetical protein
VLVPHDRIQSTVSNGWVTLGGNVDTWTEREDAERAVRNLVGVRGVADTITVFFGKPVQPEKVREAIEDALERRAEREAKRIRVEVTPEAPSNSRARFAHGRTAARRSGPLASRLASGRWKTSCRVSPWS